KEWLAFMREILSNTQDNPDHVMERIETFEWLIEQAERVEELEENLDHGAKVAVETARRLHQEREQNKRYKQALEFYADNMTYNSRFDKETCTWEITYISKDLGKKARKELGR